MTASITTRPQNSLILIAASRETADPKIFEGGESISANETCITVSCLMYQDGPTKITLGPPLRTASDLVFTGYLETPNREVAVWTIEWEKLLSAKVPTSRTRIRIWTNRLPEPDDVYIGIGE